MPSPALLSAALLLLLPLAAAALAPVDEVCALNGRLLGGACVCLRGWRGADCAELALGAADPAAGLQLPGNSTWGGAAVRDARGRWHLFASLFRNGCGLNSWQPNSMVVRAEPVDAAAAPGGAWALAEVLEGSFAHSPEARSSAADGSVTIPLIYEAGLPPCANCSAGRTGSGPGCSGWTPGTKFFGDWGTLSAPSAAGPWALERRGSCAPSAPDAVPGCPASGNDLNPSVAQAADGSLLMLWRSINFTTRGVSYLCTATAPRWGAPWAYNTTNLFPQAAGVHMEDGFVWRDAASGTWHLLAHADADGSQGGAAGMHGYSRDGVSWGLSPRNAYGASVLLRNGSSVGCRRRERPKLAFLDGSAGGPPTHLFNAVVWESERSDRSVTFVVPILEA
jgi:hypothetical protein